VQYKNTNSGRRNLLNVKSHIKKIGFELVLKTVLSDMERNSAGRLFHVAGPANEKCFFSNLLVINSTNFRTVSLSYTVSARASGQVQRLTTLLEDERLDPLVEYTFHSRELCNRLSYNVTTNVTHKQPQLVQLIEMHKPRQILIMAILAYA